MHKRREFLRNSYFSAFGYDISSDRFIIHLEPLIVLHTLNICHAITTHIFWDEIDVCFTTDILNFLFPLPIKDSHVRVYARPDSLALKLPQHTMTIIMETYTHLIGHSILFWSNWLSRNQLAENILWDLCMQYDTEIHKSFVHRPHIWRNLFFA